MEAIPLVLATGGRWPPIRVASIISGQQHRTCAEPPVIDGQARSPLRAVQGWLMAKDGLSPLPPPEEVRVLIIEDNPLIAEMICEIVTAFGYVVCGTANDIQSAHKKLCGTNFDIVLLDIGLDREQKCPELADVLHDMKVPFAFVTGYGHALDVRHERVPLLRKPFTEEQLCGVLERLVEDLPRARSTNA